MSFMQHEFFEGRYTSYSTNEGMFFVPSEYYTADDDHEDVEEHEGILCRMSAPGYLDCTEWEPCESIKQGEEYLEEMYGDMD